MTATCLMPTFGRILRDPACIQEAVYWFTQQLPVDGGMELLILNDDTTPIECDAPGVRVINVANRFLSLGDKYNAGVRLAQGTFVLPFEDDDISLPHRVVQAVRMMRTTGADYWNPGASFYEQGGRIHIDHPQGVNHNASCYLRRFAIDHPYPPNNKQDAGFDTAAKQFGRAISGTLRGVPAEWAYVYRWGHTADGHLSSRGDVDDAYRAWPTTPVPPERVVKIRPKMHRDYLRETQAAAGGRSEYYL